MNVEFAMTIYADDIQISTNIENIDFQINYIALKVTDILRNNGFTINPHKTRVHYSKYGKRRILGVNVDNYITPTRKLKRKIRAARHQKNINSLNGLNEWASCKRPNLSKDREKIDKTMINSLRTMDISFTNKELKNITNCDIMYEKNNLIMSKNPLLIAYLLIKIGKKNDAHKFIVSDKIFVIYKNNGNYKKIDKSYIPNPDNFVFIYMDKDVDVFEIIISNTNDKIKFKRIMNEIKEDIIK
jgi:hypothetical protein